MSQCFQIAPVLAMCFNPLLAAAQQPDALEQMTQRLPFQINRAMGAGWHRVPVRLFAPELGILKEAVVEIEGQLNIGINTVPHIINGVPIPYPIGFTLAQIFEGPFTVGVGDWANLEGRFFYRGTAPGNGGYVGFDDRFFTYRVVVNERTDSSGLVMPQSTGTDVAPGPVGGILFSFISGPKTEAYVSWVAALLAAEDLILDAGRMYFPILSAAGSVTITYRYQAHRQTQTPSTPQLPPFGPDTATEPSAEPQPVPAPYPNIVPHRGGGTPHQLTPEQLRGLKDG